MKKRALVLKLGAKCRSTECTEQYLYEGGGTCHVQQQDIVGVYLAFTSDRHIVSHEHHLRSRKDDAGTRRYLATKDNPRF